MYLFESLNLLIQRYLPEEQIKRLRQAYLVARDAHDGQTRSSGEPYITHPVAVACILAEMRLDCETLMAALLHDVIEDTAATYQDMEQLFGKNVAELVEGVSKLDKLTFRDKKEAQAEKPECRLNYFGVKASQPLAEWRRKGWIYADDPRGWFQWYCRYYMGRRLKLEDARQVRRWKNFARHAYQVAANCRKGDSTCRPVQRQALLHWAYDSRKI